MYNLGTGDVPPGTVSIFTIFVFEEWKIGIRSGIHFFEKLV